MSKLPDIPFASALAVIEERFRQIARFGHDFTGDDRAPRGHLLKEAHVRLLTANDLVSGRPSRRELLRARTKTVQAAALCLAEIDRLDRQLTATTYGVDESEVPF